MQSTLAPPESLTFSGKSPPAFDPGNSSDDACFSDTDYFIKTLSQIQGKALKPDLLTSIITHFYAGGDKDTTTSLETLTSSWIKKKSFIESLIKILPPLNDSSPLPCDFLLRLLRAANAVGAEAGSRADLERMASRRLDGASLKELMIPSFSHTCATLLDFDLVRRLVGGFLNLVEGSRSGGALAKVSKLLDCYLAEAAVDSHLALEEFAALASALPSHARSSEDGLYRAIDTYLKAHPGLSKQERKRLCMLMDSRKLSTEASLHAAQNERLPVRAVIQVLLSEQTKLSKQIDWSGSLSGARSPAIGPDATARCLSKRETGTQQTEIRRLKEDVLRLQSQCMNMERQIEKLSRKKNGSYFSWKKLGIPVFKGNKIGQGEGEGSGDSVGLRTPFEVKARPVGGSSGKYRRESLY